MTKNLEESRLEAIERLTSAAAAMGADGGRLDALRHHRDGRGTWSEVCAYGTACRVTRL